LAPIIDIKSFIQIISLGWVRYGNLETTI